MHRNQMVDNFHRVALQAELRGTLPQAHAHYGRALERLEENGELYTLEGQVQSARIIRDDGFTFVRAAVADVSLHEGDTPVVSLQTAEQLLQQSRVTTGVMVAGDPRDFNPQLQTPKDTIKAVRRELLAEHGATIGLLGRLATVRQVLNGEDTRGDTDAAIQTTNIEQSHYGWAHNFLRSGNNGYYRVSNAMNAARQERINGHSLHAGVWLGRAASGLVWTAFHDRTHLKDAILTAGSRTLQMRSSAVAVKSVITAP